MIGFAEFYAELRAGTGEAGQSPYPWQVALAERLASADPPRGISVPTGGGKTTTIDALVWALCVQADRRPHERTIGVRTVWAIDRRILVDEVHARAQHLVARLCAAREDEGDPLHEAALRLCSYTDGFGGPLVATRWRGQVRIEPREHHPLQPELITSTVAQVGSRLLFRGYGVSERSLALEAGLTGVDCTICLDEAHLAQPLRQSVEAVRELRSIQEPAASFGPLTLITLTATPAPSAPADCLGITTADESVLERRLGAEKIAELVTPPGNTLREQTGSLIEGVERHLDEGARRIACVVNTVSQALHLSEAVAGKLADRADQALLIGPQRPYDRARTLARHRDAIFDRITPPRPLVVIATQTIEVGLDADFEALVTQSASATALTQRFGRLNRSGCSRGRATVVRDDASPLYERDEERCWYWLSDRRRSDGTIDMSPRAIATDGGPPPDCGVPFTPTLTAATVELLQQTAPRPAPQADPPVECFLAGIDAGPADDVLVCWRSDLRLDDAGGQQYREALLTLAPPQAEELVPVSLRRFHALLAARFGDTGRAAAAARAALQDVDVEGSAPVAVAAATAETIDGSEMRFVALRGGDVLESSPTSEMRPRDLRPGDVVVLASEAGGYAHEALAPASPAPVDDIGNAVAAQHLGDRRVTFRLSAELLGDGAHPALGLCARLADGESPPTAGELAFLLEAVGADPALAAGLVSDARRVGGSPRGTADVWDELDSEGEDEGDGWDPVFEQESAGGGPAFALVVSPQTASRPDLLRPASLPPPELEAHELGVAERAASFAKAVDEGCARAISIAAQAHDHGKADDRIQAFFRGGVLTPGQELLAKSIFGTDDRRVARAAGAAAGLPRGLRHEIASVAILGEHLHRERPPRGWDFDEELALHLVATHHGLGRPWPSMPRGGSPARPFAVSRAGIAGTASGDGCDGWRGGEWLRRFVAVNRRYGAWGTAYLEAVLMLADRTVSSQGG